MSLERTEKLYDIFRSYVSHFSVKNDHIYLPLFHVVIGKAMKARMIWGGREMSIREHLFITQQSGTGKSEAVKSAKLLLEKQFGQKARIITTATDASLVGQFTETQNGKKRETKISYGALYDCDLLDWDEGSVVVKGGRFAENISDILQMAMDEPGFVSKLLGRGVIEFYTNASIVAGSYEFDRFSTTMFEKGMLQRMLHTARIFTHEETIGMNRAKIQLGKFRDIKSIMTYQTKFKEEFYSQQYSPTINFNKDANDQYEDDIIRFYEENVHSQYMDRKQHALEGFYNRMDLHVRKVAAQVALLEGSDEVDYDHMKYGMQIAGNSIDSIKLLLDRTERRVQHKALLDRKKIVFEILKKRPMNQTDLLSALRLKKTEGDWDLGFNKSIEFLSGLVTCGDLRHEAGGSGGNAKIYFINR